MNEKPKKKITSTRNSLTIILHGVLSLILLIFMVNTFFQTELDLTTKIMMSLFIIACEVVFLAIGMTRRTWTDTLFADREAFTFPIIVVVLMITVLICSTAYYRVDLRADWDTLWLFGTIFLLPAFTAYEMFLLGKAIAAKQRAYQTSADEKGKSKPSQTIQAEELDNRYDDFIQDDEQLSQSDNHP